MPRFVYKAATASGEVIQGEIDAADRQSAIDLLRSQGHVPIRAQQRTAGLAFGIGLPLSATRRSVKLSELTLQTRELATLLEAGLPLDRALSLLREIASSGAGGNLVERVQEKVRAGATLADAMEEQGSVFPADAMEEQGSVFPGYYIGMVRAGEAGGNLESVLTALADSMERAQSLRENVRGALFYPILVVIMSVISLVVLMTAVIPEFRPLFEESGASMPLLTRVVLGSSEFIGTYWWALCLVVLAGPIALALNNRSASGRLRWDRWLLGRPLIGELILKIEVARFTRTLGTLSKNGVNLLNAMTITLDTVENCAVVEALNEVRTRLAKGEGLARPMAQATVFPTLAVQLIQVGEESGALEDMLLRVADAYETEVQRTLQRMLSLLVPLITIALGIVIAVIIGAMVSAVLSAYDLPI
jgi:general secretion pathway protein F